MKTGQRGLKGPFGNESSERSINHSEFKNGDQKIITFEQRYEKTI